MSYFLAYSGLLYIVGCMAGLQMAPYDLLVLLSIGIAAVPMKYLLGGFRFSRAAVFCILLFAVFCSGVLSGAVCDRVETGAMAAVGTAGERVTVTGTVVDIGEKTYVVQLENGVGLTVVEREKTDVARGDCVRVTGTLQPYANVQYRGGIHQRFFYAVRGVHGLLYGAGVQKMGHDNRFSLHAVGYQARSWISGRLQNVLEGWVLQLTEAMLTGQNQMDEVLQSNLRLSGISHIAAASGLHVGIFLVLFALVRRPLRRHPLLHAIVTAMLVFAYMVLVGGRASVLRAGIMAILAAFVTAGRRRCDSFTNLTVAGAALCALNPYYAVDVGFQFSFVAALGLILFLGRQRSGTAAASTVVMLCLLPLTTFYYNVLSLETILVNVLVVPLVPAILVLGYLTCLFPVAACLLRPLVGAVLLISSFFAGQQALHPKVPSVSGLWIAAWLLFLVLIYRLQRRRRITVVASLLLLTVTAGIVSGTVQRQYSYFYVMYHQGRSMVHIHTRNGQNILVDGGNAGITYAKKTGIRRFDAVLLTQVTQSSRAHLQALYEAGICNRAIVPLGTVFSNVGLENMELLYYNREHADLVIQGVPVTCREERGDHYVRWELDGVKGVLSVDGRLVGQLLPCDVLILPPNCQNSGQAAIRNSASAIITSDYLEHERIYSTPIDGGIYIPVRNGTCVPRPYFRREFFR